MKKALVLCLAVLFAVTALATVASAKKVERQELRFESLARPDAPLPPDLVGQVGALRSAAVADTFVLLDEDFDASNGDINNLPGWSTVDITDQLEAYWHVADGTELDGGTFGNLLPLNGSKSMWCGKDASTAVPYCGYRYLPGYGNGWDQILESSAVGGDSIRLQYNVFWDSEPGYDGTVVEYTFDGVTWYSFAITDTLSARAGIYDGISLTPYITETVTNDIPGIPAGTVQARFRFNADGAWSDEDGLWPTDGAILVDDITLQTWLDGTPVTDNTENFDTRTTGSNIAGLWTGKKAPAFGDYGALYPGVSVTQEDPCDFRALFMFAFFDDPAVTNYDCHTPNPLPGQGAMPYGTPDGIYMHNEVWSPPVANIGTGLEYRVRLGTYRDLPLDNLQFYVWHVRSWTDPDGGGPLPLCPGNWDDDNYVYYGGQRDWIDRPFQVGARLDATAEELQVAIGARDMCGFWCNAVGSGACHSHAPLIDDLRLERIATFGPQYSVRHLELFQDNFAEDGTITGTARADIANDINPYGEGSILPGDSLVMTISPIADIGGPSVWLYARVQNSNAPKSGAGLGSPNGRDPGQPVGPTPRWPYAGSWMDANGNTWEKFQADSSFTSGGGWSPNQYCADLNDALLVPGDTVWYFVEADVDGSLGNGNENYLYRTLDGQGTLTSTADKEEAAASPMEFTILPAGGYNRGGDILYVDDTDDRGGPAQLFFDSSFDLLGIRDLVDRYDVLAPSSSVSNGLGARVTSNINQIINVYRTIIWNSGNLNSATIGDGTGNPEKSDDFAVLEQFIRTSDKGPGLYISGDGIAEEWVTLAGPSAILLKSGYIPFDLLDGDHINFGEAVSPTFTATSAPFSPGGVPNVFVGYGGCALINDFDVLLPTGVSQEDFPYPNAGTGNGSVVISSQQANSAAATATVVLSGISYTYIRDAAVQFPPARTEHLRRILIYMGQTVPAASGITPGADQFANRLYDAYPNPFNPTTTIKYTIKERAHVSLKVYNVAGQLVRTLVDEVQAPDKIQPLTWDGQNNAGQTVSSGVYFYKLSTKNFSQTKKMVLLK
jgi:hypothetical protein